MTAQQLYEQLGAAIEAGSGHCIVKVWDGMGGWSAIETLHLDDDAEEMRMI